MNPTQEFLVNVAMILERTPRDLDGYVKLRDPEARELARRARQLAGPPPKPTLLTMPTPMTPMGCAPSMLRRSAA